MLLKNINNFIRIIKYLSINFFNMNTDETYLILDTKYLKPSPINLEIYGEEETDYRLIDSIKEKGQLEPLTVIKDKEVPGEYVIISGHRRWAALKVENKKPIVVLYLSVMMSSK